MAILCACASRVGIASTVLPYGSFGPQAMSYETLGFEWWQWQPHGDSRPREYDIRVVIYCHASADDMARLYPVDPAAEKDYRYISYRDALTYLDRNISDDVDPSLTDELRETRRQIIEQLPSCSE